MPRSIFAPIGRAFIPASRGNEIKEAVRDFLKYDAYGLSYGAQPVAIGAFFGSVADAAGPPRRRDEIFEVNLGSAKFPGDDCRGLNASEARSWQETADGLSAQFADYGLPIRVLFDADLRAVANNTGPHSAELPVSVCDLPSPFAGGYASYSRPIDQLQGMKEAMGNGRIEIELNVASIEAHEIGHALGLNHPHLGRSIESIQPDVARLICEGSAYTLPSRMRYAEVCEEAGFQNSRDGARDRGKLGPTDLCALELATTHHTQQEAVLANCENKIYDHIAVVAGTRVAWFFAASVASTLVERALVHVVFRQTDAGFDRKVALVAVSGVAALVRAFIVAQGVGGIAALVAGTTAANLGVPLVVFAGGLAVKGAVSSGLLGPLVRSVADLIDEYNLFAVLFGASQDRIWTLSALVGSVAGTSTGNAVGALLDALLEHCAPLSEAARAAKVEYYRPASEKPPQAWPAFMQPAVDAVNSGVPAVMSTSYEKVVAIQRSLGAGIDRYFALGGLTMYICPADQKSVDVEHGIERIVRDAEEAAEAVDVVADGDDASNAACATAASSDEDDGYFTAEDS